MRIVGSPISRGPLPPVPPLTLSSPTKATLFRIILWRCWAPAEHGIARTQNASSAIRAASLNGKTHWNNPRLLGVELAALRETPASEALSLSPLAGRGFFRVGWSSHPPASLLTHAGSHFVFLVNAPLRSVARWVKIAPPAPTRA